MQLVPGCAWCSGCHGGHAQARAALRGRRAGRAGPGWARRRACARLLACCPRSAASAWLLLTPATKLVATAISRTRASAARAACRRVQRPARQLQTPRWL